MSGGTFTAQDKVRPGAYVNTKGEPIATPSEGINGVVTMPIVADFGPVKEVVEVNSNTNFARLFGEELSSKNLMLVNEALKKAFKILLYRVNGGEKATGEIADGFNATAKHPGAIGNNLRVAVRVNVDEPDKFDVLTYLDSKLVESQLELKNAEEVKNNHWIEFNGTGALKTNAGITLSGGSTDESTAGDYADYLEDISVYEFNTMAITTEEETTKMAAANFVKRLRDDEGMKCQAAVGRYAANHEGVIDLANGVVLGNGVKLSPEQCTAFVAGATASARVNESLTYSEYEGAVDVYPRLRGKEIEEALREGKMVFTMHKGKVVIEQDINSLTEFVAPKHKDFRKNRVLRVLDDIANNSRDVFLSNFAGTMDNEEDGRAMFLANRLAYFSALQDLKAIKDFSADDIVVSPGEEKDSIVLDVFVEPVDSAEKLYQTVHAQ